MTVTGLFRHTHEIGGMLQLAFDRDPGPDRSRRFERGERVAGRGRFARVIEIRGGGASDSMVGQQFDGVLQLMADHRHQLDRAADAVHDDPQQTKALAGDDRVREARVNSVPAAPSLDVNDAVGAFDRPDETPERW